MTTMEHAKEQWAFNKIDKRLSFKAYEIQALGIINSIVAKAILGVFEGAVVTGSIKTAIGEDLKKIAHVLGVADNVE